MAGLLVFEQRQGGILNAAVVDVVAEDVYKRQDGTCSNNDLDMWDEMRTASFLQKVATMDPCCLLYTSLAVPSIWLRSRWDFIQNRAGILVQQRENLDTLVRGFYAPSQKRYYARATLDAVELSALDPLLKGVVERTGGNAEDVYKRQPLYVAG